MRSKKKDRSRRAGYFRNEILSEMKHVELKRWCESNDRATVLTTGSVRKFFSDSGIPLADTMIMKR